MSSYDVKKPISQTEQNTAQRLGRNGGAAGLFILAIKMLTTMEKRVLNGEVVYVGEAITSFSLHTKPSTNVEYFGSAPGKVFVQFKTGHTYVYSQVPDDIRAGMERADSIGGFIAQMIVKPNLYPSVKYSDRLVKLEKDGQFNAVDQWS